MQSKDFNDVKIGIVIPIYNVAEYLSKCLDSVVNQSYRNIEVVLVNDGSTDIDEDGWSQSLKIALNYVAQDSRVILFDKKNGGLSSARNLGIAYFNREIKVNFCNKLTNSIVKTSCDYKNLTEKVIEITSYTNLSITSLVPCKIDYIIFLDSDDFWETDLLEKCLQSARTYKADIVWFGWKTFYNSVENHHTDDFTWLNYHGYTQKDIISNMDWLNTVANKNIDVFACAWDKFINFQYLQKIKLRFLEGVIWEDVLFAELLFAQSKKIVTLPEKLVYYRIRHDSISNLHDVKQKKIPPFIKSLEKYFKNADETWAYFSAYSWCKIMDSFVEFCKTYDNKSICNKLKKYFLGHLLAKSSTITNFTCDPYYAHDIFVQSITQFGRKYLPKGKRHFIYYKVPILSRIILTVHILYQNLKNLKRKIYYWRNSKKG